MPILFTSLIRTKLYTSFNWDLPWHPPPPPQCPLYGSLGMSLLVSPRVKKGFLIPILKICSRTLVNKEKVFYFASMIAYKRPPWSSPDWRPCLKIPYRSFNRLDLHVRKLSTVTFFALPNLTSRNTFRAEEELR